MTRGLDRIGNGFACHRTTFCASGKTYKCTDLWMKFLAGCLKQTFPLNQTKLWLVSHQFAPIREMLLEGFWVLVSRYLIKELFCFYLVSYISIVRGVCRQYWALPLNRGGRYWLIFDKSSFEFCMRTIYVSFGMIITVGDAIWKIHSSSNISDEGMPNFCITSNLAEGCPPRFSVTSCWVLVALTGSYFLQSCFSAGVYCTRYPSTEPRQIDSEVVACMVFTRSGQFVVCFERLSLQGFRCCLLGPS